MQFRTLVLVAAALCATGCVPSLHPFYTSETTVFEPALLGTWENPGDNETWTFQSVDDTRFILTFTDSEGLPGEFEATLLSLNQRMFLDLYPELPDLESNEFYASHLLAIHTLIRVDLSDSGLSLSGMSLEWMDEYADGGAGEVDFERLDNTLVLTSSTAELQAFVMKHMDDENFFSESDHLVRPQ